jgi:hypothetical protein
MHGTKYGYEIAADAETCWKIASPCTMCVCTQEYLRSFLAGVDRFQVVVAQFVFLPWNQIKYIILLFKKAQNTFQNPLEK